MSKFMLKGFVFAVFLLALFSAWQTTLLLENPSENFHLPDCSKTASGQRIVGWGKYGLHFLVTKKEVKVLGGKPDVDYVRYVIRPEERESFLELWFGPYGLNPEPDRERIQHSSGIMQTKIVDVTGAVVGLDSRGFLNGGHWRQFAVAGQGGAVYDRAAPDDVVLFDRIISSACEIPYPDA